MLPKFPSNLTLRWQICALFAAFLAVCPTSATQPTTACPDHFAGATPPQLTNARLAPKTRELCAQGFAVLHSGVTRSPLFAAEHLSRASLTAAKEQVRVNSFRADTRLALDDRAELRDYVRSGYDRGHLAPSGNMPTEDAQDESFLLSNIVPQDPTNNRFLWSGIESTTRLLAKRSGGLYVVTGAIYSSGQLSTVGDRVIVPTHLYKALYDPVTGQTAAYLVRNDDLPQYATIDLATLERLSGVRVFPGVATKRRSIDLPGPFTRGAATSRYQRVSYGVLFDLAQKNTIQP